MGARGVHRQVIAVAHAIQGRELGVVDHEVGALGKRTVASVAANAARHRRPRARAANHTVTVSAELSRRSLGVVYVAVGDQDSAHDCSSMVRLSVSVWSWSAALTTPRGVVCTNPTR